jgi:hypothetical protein
MSGSSKSETKVPEWQNRAARDALAAANRVANIGYTPYYGPDVAAMTPMQMAALQGTNQAASAFGMPTSDLSKGMPKAQNFNGVMAYSSGDMYGQALAELKRRNPEQYAALMAQFMPERAQGNGGGGGNGGNGGGGGNGGSNRSRGNGGGVLGYEGGTSTGGGYISIGDMFDGGGAGQSGSTFVGGPLSGTLNTIGVRPVGSSATPPPAPAPRPVYPPPAVIRPRSEYF